MRLVTYKYLFVFSFFQLLVSFGVPVSLFAQGKIQQFDERILNDLAAQRTPEKTAFFRFISDSYPYGDVGVPAGLFIGGVIGHDQQMRQNALYVGSSTVLSYALTTLIKHIVKRPRPFVRNINFVPVYRAQNSSFPSGHTSSTFATATALSIAYPKWYVIAPSYLWAGAVGYSRMYLGVHYPTDVAGGIVVGAGSAASTLFLKK
ncbi:phosphatase PAP2 family protein [Mucilaginibacter paludis]|uniref:Phosphoesterase PA-phosphatase related protein n=1 Tax=Mucilaginibacter paludis DSM 18603 TaxID=714943 RepID=H1YB85_9SPHI|nr:phosphatase PAP2 family protein [Mucilaginibacter paludis]EHQ30611.1 phosphoesterase PA-phosphatase related protein [Mucilaginibacter paludis DSM 18603]